MNDVNKPNLVWKKCFRESNFASGRWDAFTFAVDVKCNVDLLSDKLADREESLRNPEFMHGSHAPGTSVRNNIDGFMAGLREAMQIVSDARNSSLPSDVSPIDLAVQKCEREKHVAQGRRDALFFTQDVNNALDRLFDKAIEQGKRLQDQHLLATSLVPGTSGRLYLDSYLATLEEVIRAVQEST